MAAENAANADRRRSVSAHEFPLSNYITEFEFDAAVFARPPKPSFVLAPDKNHSKPIRNPTVTKMSFCSLLSPASSNELM
jgi:hypothetical protein